MGKVVYDISMSLDGYVTGANPRLEAGLGDGGERLHEWAFKSQDPRNREIIEAWVNAGAAVVGRTTYELSIPHWGADGPIPEKRVPVVIVSHRVPAEVPAGGVYTFVDSVEAAYKKAQEAAGDKLIGVQGPDIARQFIQHGYVDEIGVHLVPVLFGNGLRLYEAVGGEHVALEPMEVINTPEAVHLRYRVVK